MEPGAVVSHYRVIALLGAGGMGEVYKAEDTRLKRAVALKVLPAALVADPAAKQRLIVEAQAISTLDHPNICTIHEIDETPEGRVFLAMAYYEGETLAQRIARGTVSVTEALDLMVQVTRGVAAAHDAGIIHRDIKPANIFLCVRTAARAQTDAPSDATASAHGGDDTARVKLLDFGIAKQVGQTSLTRTGTTVGTAAYMAPEHIAGHAIDQRADVWSLGVVFYELLAGCRPFSGAHELSIIRAIADDVPRPLSQVRADVPQAVQDCVDKALQKDPRQRYATAHKLLEQLESLRTTSRITTADAQTPSATGQSWLNARVWAMGAAVLVVVAALGVWFTFRESRARESRQALDVIGGMVESEQFAAALRRLHAIPPTLKNDADIVKLQNDFFLPLAVRTDPPGADLYVKGYGEPDAEWIHLGRAPVETRGTPGAFRWRVSHAGRETFEGSGEALGVLSFDLPAEGETPAGMVRIPGANVALAGGRVPDFFIDRYEVTNREFKRFVDAGGYREERYWKEPFVRESRPVTWSQASAAFRDTTGRPGPATWELGTYPQGQDDWPVGGISWYEAAAYARFAGKALPTVHHWNLATQLGISPHSDILEWSNFSGKGPTRVGQYPGIGPFGTYDMAGNVKEWCMNAVAHRRYIMGGGWNEPNYQYRNPDARDAFDRSPNNGVRLITLPDPSAVPAKASEPVPSLARDYSREKPVGDEVYAALARLYASDADDLNVQVESVNDDAEAWRVERVSYNAAYGGERIIAYLFLPKNASPPYQTVVYFPHSGGLFLDSFQQAEMAYLGFPIKAGRALLFPMYKGTYERRLKTPPTGPNAARDRMIQQVKDVVRSVDYLRTRSDIAHDRLAFFGVSMGAAMAPMILSIERRFKTAVLWSGGLPQSGRPPETDPINFAPRVTTPVLMLNGRDDFTFPVESSQEPMFRLLGTPPADKARVLYDGGHIFPFSRMMKDSLDWFDRYLGIPK